MVPSASPADAGPLPPKRGVNVANVIALLILGGLAAVYVVYQLSHPPHVVSIAELRGGTGQLLVEGTVRSINEANKRVNALELHDEQLGMFDLVDSSGTLTVYTTVGIPEPAASSRVHVEGSFFEQSGSATARRFVAKSVTPLP